MFSLKDIPSSFHWPIVVRFPKDGGFLEKRFTAEFALLPQEEVEEIIREVRQSEDEDSNLSAGLIERIWLGWGEDVTDESGAPLPVTESTRRALRQVIPVRNAVVKAWLEAMAGKKAARKN